MTAEKSRCPSLEKLRSFAARPLDADGEAVAQHVFVCEECRRRVEELLYHDVQSLLTAGEKLTIRNFVAARCAPASTRAERLDAFVKARQSCFFDADLSDWRAAAAAARMRGKTDGVREDVKFVYVSEESASSDDFWRAELEMPRSANGSDPLDIEIFGFDGDRTGDGVFCVAGVALPVERGMSEIPFDTFLAGLRNPQVSFRRETAAPVAGNLVFF